MLVAASSYSPPESPDKLPDIPGIRDWWGIGALHCPFCRGWEVRDEPWACIAPPRRRSSGATLLSGWSKSLTYLTNGGPRPAADQLKWLEDHRVAVREEKIVGLDGKEGKLTGVTFDGGQPLGVRAVFVLPELLFSAPTCRRSSGARC